jgi:hypothetical protein
MHDDDDVRASITGLLRSAGPRSVAFATPRAMKSGRRRVPAPRGGAGAGEEPGRPPAGVAHQPDTPRERRQRRFPPRNARCLAWC